MSNTDRSNTDLPDIGRPAAGALTQAGVTGLEQVSQWSERQLLALHGVGPKAIRILRQALAERGMTFTT